MKKNKILILVIPFLFCLISMGKHGSKNLLVVKTTEQLYHGGMRGSASGSYWRIKLVILQKNNFTFDSIEMNGMKFKTEIDNINSLKKISFNIGDTVKLLSVSATNDFNKINAVEKTKSNQLLYHCGNAKQKITLPVFEKIKPLYYP